MLLAGIGQQEASQNDLSAARQLTCERGPVCGQLGVSDDHGSPTRRSLNLDEMLVCCFAMGEVLIFREVSRILLRDTANQKAEGPGLELYAKGCAGPKSSRGLGSLFRRHACKTELSGCASRAVANLS